MFNLLPTGRLPGPGRGVCRGDDELGRGAEALQRQRGKPHPVQLGRGAGTDMYVLFDIVWNGKYITSSPASPMPNVQVPSPYRNVLFKEKVLVVVFLVFSFPNLVKHG